MLGGERGDDALKRRFALGIPDGARRPALNQACAPARPRLNAQAAAERRRLAEKRRRPGQGLAGVAQAPAPPLLLSVQTAPKLPTMASAPR